MANWFTTAMLGITGALAALPASAAPLPTWYGTYVWEESLGRVGGEGRDGVAIFVTRTLTLGPSAGSTGCRLSAEGYQTFEELKCTATPEMESVIIKLYKFRPTDAGRGPSGTRLFRIVRTENGLMTRLESYDATSDATPRSGRLFRRVG
ncbi:hypothetical protein F1C10_10635 [Sphingomonas sp. NBWT7]|uniref:DUF5991 domain-containing protein n=1 Tax=Sphingomonas sp. NBWT7 TaxID=2596913 RepID=UPI00162340EC|nr:DUF5991 domain-containing protein [Sphingomonas sp. NBWT7]QNE32356.1 hypothetical protein F1C10_10635 [Sphingomonas sp. NBWT7]